MEANISLYYMHIIDYIISIACLPTAILKCPYNSHISLQLLGNFPSPMGCLSWPRLAYFSSSLLGLMPAILSELCEVP